MAAADDDVELHAGSGEHVTLEIVLRRRPGADDHLGRILGQGLAGIEPDDPVGVRHGLAPAVAVRCGDLHSPALQEAREGSVARADLQTAPGSDHPGQRLDQFARVETVDALGLHQRHEAFLLPDQRPEQAEPEQRDRLALQPFREQQLLRDEAVEQVEAQLAFGRAGIGGQRGEAKLLDRLVRHAAADELRQGGFLALLRLPGRRGEALQVGLQLFRDAALDDGGNLLLHRRPFRGIPCAELIQRGVRLQPLQGFRVVFLLHGNVVEIAGLKFRRSPTT